MNSITLASAAAVAILASVSVVTAAENSPNSMKLSRSDCSKLWQQANPSNAKGLTEAQSAPYVTNFKAANPDGDSTIDMNEWQAACNKGLVKSSSSSGSSTGQ